MNRKTWTAAVAAGAFTTALVGGVALAGFQPFAGSNEAVAGDPGAGLLEKDQPKDNKDKLKEILDGLVAKNTITQAQEDAILQALKDAAPPPKPNVRPVHPGVPGAMAFLGDLTKAASEYLGMDLKTLLAQLRGGKTIADVANGLSAQGKSAQGLVDLLTKRADDKVDAGVAANKLTADQAATLKPKIAAEIQKFVNRSFPSTAPHLPRPLAPVKPSPSPKS